MKNKKNICTEYDYLLNHNQNYMNYTALSFENREKITYEELHCKIDEYTRALTKKGITKGDKIGILLENSPEAVYLYYALGRIGAIRIGLNLFNNKYKMNRDFEILKPQRVIAVNTMYEAIKDPSAALNISPILYSNHGENINIPHTEDLQDIIKNGKKRLLITPLINETEVTDILFTGGSSGFHKGVMLNQQGLNSIITGLENTFILKPGMIHLGNIPFGPMVFGRFAMHYALSHNLEYALTLKSLPFDFLSELIRTQAHGTMGGPVHYNTLPGHALLKPESIPNLIQASTGGEDLKPEDEKNANEAIKYGGGSAELINMLGLTEMSGLTHICDPKKNTKGTLGSPISTIKDMVVDERLINANEDNPGQNYYLKDLPNNETGVLLTKGDSMFLGYYNNQAETDKVIIYDENGEKWYNTNDLVCRTGKNNKEIKFIGRRGRNFVCNCTNIYPEQIEELVITIPEVMEIVVTPVPDKTYQFLPVYHIYLKDESVNTDLLQNKIECLIESTLGAPYLPGYIEYYNKPLPKTDRNKLNAKLLKELALEKFENKTLTLVQKMY